MTAHRVRLVANRPFKGHVVRLRATFGPHPFALPRIDDGTDMAWAAVLGLLGAAVLVGISVAELGVQLGWWA